MMVRFDEALSPTPVDMLHAGFENNTMHSSFTLDDIRLMAYDRCDDKLTLHDFHLALSVATEAAAHKAFSALWMGMVPGEQPKVK